ncbi:hypothetical protein Dsin_007147 [Dipteronia sinensis]|uniref:MYB-CC type transcription factor LHEQLE-containing domain-containing protein n=1 Tax=Dipteronia sinensis TaxID=43782 RepID=A0AAE0B0M6_9ROSI|nr:hypothetical protein Dsin_007147 [Dipteronia sinensis]
MMNMNERQPAIFFQGDDYSSSGLALTTDTRPRLRWTAQLHHRFIEAVTHLGGPDTVLDRNAAAATSGIPSCNLIDHQNIHRDQALQLQMKVRSRLNEKLEVERQLQRRIDAHGNYMQKLLEKACQTISNIENNMSSQTQSDTFFNMKPFGFPLNFESCDHNNFGIIRTLSPDIYSNSPWCDD